MTKNTIKFEKGEKDILERFYNRLRDTLVRGYGYNDEEADFEAYKWIMKETSKPAKEYFKIFTCIPKGAQEKIAKHIGYNNVNEFKKNFSKQLNIYRQGAFRREEKGENNESQNQEDVM